MPAATNKAALLAVTDKEFAKLAGLLDTVSEAEALAVDDDGIAIKDIVGHRAHWIGLFQTWYRIGQSGETPDLPAPGYKWNELKRYNADLRRAQAGLTWDAAQADLRDAAAALRAFLEARDNAALYGGPMPGGGNAWTTGRWAEAAGASHYRSAAKYIRARLRDLRRENATGAGR